MMAPKALPATWILLVRGGGFWPPRRRNWSYLQVADEFFDLIGISSDKREGDDRTFPDHDQRRLIHGQFSARLAEIFTNQLRCPDGEWARLAHRRKTVRGRGFSERLKVFQRGFDLGIGQCGLRRNHDSRVDGLPGRLRRTLEHSQQYLRGGTVVRSLHGLRAIHPSKRNSARKSQR